MDLDNRQNKELAMRDEFNNSETLIGDISMSSSYAARIDDFDYDKVRQ